MSDALTGEAWTFLGVALSVLGAFAIAVRNSRAGHPSDRSASAAEVTALGARLDIAVHRIDSHEATIRGLRDYIAADHAEHRANSWPIRPLPEDLA